MPSTRHSTVTILTALIAATIPAFAAAQSESGHALSEAEATLPQLHHIGLNSVDPDRAIEWYLRLLPGAKRTMVGTEPGVQGDMLLLFNKVGGAPRGAFREDIQRSEAPSPFVSIGATLPGATREDLEARGFKVLPLYVSAEEVNHPIWRSGLAPYAGTKTADEIPAAGKLAPRDGGFGFLVGPDGVLFEITTNAEALPSLSHMRFQHEEPLCAVRWYMDNLGMALPRMIDSVGRAITRPDYLSDCAQDPGPPSWPSLEYGGTLRQPLGVVRYATGSLAWYPNQCEDGRCPGRGSLSASRGQPLDHIAFTIKDFDTRVARLRNRGVKFLLEPYQFGNSRAVMIQDPDGLAIELIDGGGQLQPRPKP